MQISKREQFVKTYRARMVLAFLFCSIFAFIMLADIVRVELDNAESSLGWPCRCSVGSPLC